ncbi:MAG: hypothetical protein SFY66_14485 [Oculatellaceae cyanobacterium bins.114]|nr:hypothetical protein [Oculatellaceae cyanobacterium bins.114]
MKQIPTCKLLRGFRSGGSRLRSTDGERSRIMAGYAEIQMQETRRQWLKDIWYNRETGRC